MSESSVPYLCLVLAALLIYVPRLVVIRELRRGPEPYDNRLPRVQQARLAGLGARAQGAHLNSFEAFLLFAVGVLGSEGAGVGPHPISVLACGFVGFRVVWLGLYLADRPTGRSIVWGFGFACSVLLLGLPLLR